MDENKSILGYVSIVPKGPYSPTATYNRLNVVSHNGGSYMLIVNTPTTGVEPVDGATWMQLASAGEGITVSAQETAYVASSQGDTPPESGWQTTIPEVSAGSYLWARITTTFSDGSSFSTYMVTRFGVNGTGAVSSVNGVSPDATGNVQLTIGSIASIDSVPTQNSNNLVTSGGVYARINAILSSTQVKIQNGTITLPAASWTGSGPYTQPVTVAGSTAQSQINIQGNQTAITAANAGGFSVLISNTGGTLTAYAVGNKPAVDLTLQITIVELSGATGTIPGAPLVGSGVPDGGVTFLKLAQNAKTLSWENITVPDSAWAESTDFQNYPWRAAILLPGSGVDATYLPTVDFTEESLNAVDLGPDAISYAGGVYIYAATAPEVLVKLNTLAVEPTLVGTLASSVFASIAVTYAAGATLTATDGTTTLTAKSTSGKWTFAIPYAGQWAISDGENERIVNITTQGQAVSVDLGTSDIVLYSPGATSGFTSIAWKSDSSQGANAPTLEYETDTLIISAIGAGGTTGVAYYSNPVELDGFREIMLSCVIDGSPANDVNLLGIWSEVGNGYYAAEAAKTAIITEAGEQTVRLDVSDITGTYYIGLGLRRGSSQIVANIIDWRVIA